MNAVARLRKSNFRKNLNYTFVTAFAAACLAIFLIPFLYMIFTSLKTHEQMTALNAPIMAGSQSQTYHSPVENTGTYTFQVDKSGKLSDLTINMKDYAGKTLDIYTVPLADGTKKNLALVQGFTQYAVFMDPQNPTADPDPLDRRRWQRWPCKTLPIPWVFSPTWSNYPACMEPGMPRTERYLQALPGRILEHLFLCLLPRPSAY